MADYIIRATAADGQIRAFASTTRDLVEEARKAHNTSPVATAALGRLLTAGGMMGSMMKGEDDLLTIKIQGDGPMEGLTITADSKGDVKGYVYNPDVMLPPNAKGKLDVGGALGVGVLSVIQDIGLKEPYVGQTILVTGEIAEDLTYYYATSEQTPSSVSLGVLMNKDNTVCQAGGFIIQLMPGASEEIISSLEKKLGHTLFVRSTKRVILTPEGELLLQHVKPALSMLNEGEAALSGEGNLTGQLRIGASDTLCRYFLIPYLRRFHKDHPEVRIKIINITSMTMC